MLKDSFGREVVPGDILCIPRNNTTTIVRVTHLSRHGNLIASNEIIGTNNGPALCSCTYIIDYYRCARSLKIDKDTFRTIKTILNEED